MLKQSNFSKVDKKATGIESKRKKVYKKKKVVKRYFYNHPRPSPLHKLLNNMSVLPFEVKTSDLRHDPNMSLRTHDWRRYASLDEDNLSFSQSLVDPLSEYRFRLGGYTTLSQTSGVINSFLAADPSASGWNSPEWSTLSALFSEFRLVELGVRVVRNYNVTVSNNISALAICSNLGTAVNPGSYAASADNADVTWYSYVETARYKDGACGYVHRMKATNLNWSQVTTPTVEPYAGAPGSIQFYSDNTTAAGTLSNVFQVLIWGIYDFRIRV